jgi:hypothetical protein
VKARFYLSIASLIMLVYLKDTKIRREQAVAWA